MARQQRHFFPGATYHVMLRGNKDQSIFLSDDERCKFCLLLQEGVERYKHHILAFCFMTNHVHLAIQVADTPLSKIIHNLSFRYTQYYNTRHDTTGHLFQGRFKSLLVDSKSYLKELIRYIHLNPVRANIIDDPMQYRWSSHQAYFMKAHYTWLSQQLALVHFGAYKTDALHYLQAFIAAGCTTESAIDFQRGTATGILGDEEFINKVKNRTIPSQQTTACCDITSLMKVITTYYNITEEELCSGIHNLKSCRIRAIMALFARDTKGITVKEIADLFRKDSSSMSKAASRLEQQMKKNDALVLEVADIMNALMHTTKQTN